jgi:hypothetical protein
MNLKRKVCKDYMLPFRFETFASEWAERLQLAGIQPHPKDKFSSGVLFNCRYSSLPRASFEPRLKLKPVHGHRPWAMKRTCEARNFGDQNCCSSSRANQIKAKPKSSIQSINLFLMTSTREIRVAYSRDCFKKRKRKRKLITSRFHYESPGMKHEPVDSYPSL